MEIGTNMVIKTTMRININIQIKISVIVQEFSASGMPQ